MQAGTPLSIETPPKSSGNTDKGLMKKLKRFDGLAMSIGIGHAESWECGAANMLSQRFVICFLHVLILLTTFFLLFSILTLGVGISDTP